MGVTGNKRDVKGVVFLDSETTGLQPPRDRVVELALIDGQGTVLLNTLVDPERAIPERVVKIHGITDAMVAGAPSFTEVLAALERHLSSAGRLVIYNADFDLAFFPAHVRESLEVICVMKWFIAIYEALEGHFSSRRFPLAKAFNLATGRDIRSLGPPHRALTDCRAAWHVWRWCEEKSAFIDSHPDASRTRRAYCDRCRKETPFRLRLRYREDYPRYYECQECLENHISLSDMAKTLKKSKETATEGD